MFVSITICTWNRAQLLEQTLRSLEAMEVPDDVDWEVIVVDNNCTDETPDVVASFLQRLPLRSVIEEKQGHSHSRNRAIAESTGDFILWTDDDVIVSPQWLSQYCQAFAGPTEVGFWGGTIEPLFESTPPKWLQENWRRCGGVFAVRDFGSEPVEFTKRKLPFGANFAIRRSLQERFGYDSRFGRVSDVSVRGYDEIDVLTQVIDAGFRGHSVPGATLQHFIPTARMSLDYVRQFYEGQGETWVLRGESDAPSRQLAINYWSHQLGYRLRRCIGPTAKWFDHLVKASRARGQWKKRAELARAGS